MFKLCALAVLFLSTCPKFMVASIGECDANFCQVQFTNGLFGKAKRPVKVLDMVEVCGGRSF